MVLVAAGGIRLAREGERACLMEYYAPAKGAPSSFAGLEPSASDPSLSSIPLYEDWRQHMHGAPSPGSTGGDTGPEGILSTSELLQLDPLPPLSACVIHPSTTGSHRTGGKEELLQHTGMVGTRSNSILCSPDSGRGMLTVCGVHWDLPWVSKFTEDTSIFRVRDDVRAS